MSRRKKGEQLVEQLVLVAARNPKVTLIVLLAAAAFFLVYLLAIRFARPRGPYVGDYKPDSYLLCFWNCENLFDDQINEKTRDEIYDDWFAEDPEARKLKYDHLASVLADLNGGKGPDLLALAEVEAKSRAPQLLADAIMARVGGRAPPYNFIAFEDPNDSRGIAPALLSRVPVKKTILPDKQKRMRTLEVVLEQDGHELVVVVSHWTSRLKDGEGRSIERRAEYGDRIYGLFNRMYQRDAGVAFLACGDFNDDPTDESVRDHLRAIGDLDRVKEGGKRPYLYDLFANRSAKDEGTHYHSGWHLFDHIVVSPGLLDGDGWRCQVETAKIVNGSPPADKKGRPMDFGSKRSKGERGYSDHFPVTVRLTRPK